MRKVILLFSIVALFFAACDSNKRPEKECNTFSEMPDPNADTANWKSQGFIVSYGSINDRYAKYKEPGINITKQHKVTGWKGEKVSAQIVVWTSAPVKQLECEVTDLKSGQNIIPQSTAQVRIVRYVMTDIFEPGCGYRKPENFPANLVADMLDNIECIDMDAKSVRPVWITFDIPADAVAGTYTGKINVYARNNKTQALDIELEVIDRTLPPAKDWAYHLDLWQHPSAVARAQSLTLWSDEHFAAMKPLFKMLANAGQKVITANINKEPWNNQCYDKYEDMIIWTKNEDGSWTYDYTIFDKWVTFMMNEVGINKMINCYSMVPWNNEIHYKDAKTGEFINVKADPGTKVFEEMWTPFLKDFVKHLNGKGWLNITNIAMDERSPKEMDATLTLLKEVAPELGISFADNHKSYKKYTYIKDLCVGLEAIVDSADLAYRKEQGLNTTYYVCCSHKFSNVFTFSAPAEAVYAAWYAKAHGYDGFLRWAYNSWVENPVLDSRFRTWPGGDTYIVYPEARSSIRFERLLEGVQDFEKIRILEKELSADKLEELKAAISQFKASRGVENVSAMVDNAKKLLN